MGARDPNGLSTHLTVVGCGTAAPDGERVCSGYLLETEDTRILFDCGPGVVHGMARHDLPWQRITHVALSHFHTDHIGDVPMLLFALQYGMLPARTAPITIIGPRGLRERLQAMKQAFGNYVTDASFGVGVHEIAPDTPFQAGAAELSVARTRHTEESIAYRISTRDCTIGYTGDTGPCDDLGDFLYGVDELIAECSLPDEQALAIHLTPVSLAALARRARPRRLIVTHVYPQLDRAGVPGQLRAHGWGGETVVAADGMSLR